MRQISPLTNLVLAVLAAVGLLGALGLPWYAPTVHVHKAALTDVAEGNGDGPMQHFSQWVGRVFSHGGTTYTGNEALGSQRTMLLALAAVIIVLCVAMAVPALRNPLRDVLRAIGLATPLLVAFFAFKHPGQRETEIRYGLIVAIGIALFIASAAWWGSEAPKKKKAAQVRPARA